MDPRYWREFKIVSWVRFIALVFILGQSIFLARITFSSFKIPDYDYISDAPVHRGIPQ